MVFIAVLLTIGIFAIIVLLHLMRLLACGLAVMVLLALLGI